MFVFVCVCYFLGFELIPFFSIMYIPGCVRDWCLMCELEQHVMMLRESGGPLSPSRILSHMRSINCQIGDGSQEDAHEFLRSVMNNFVCMRFVSE